MLGVCGDTPVALVPESGDSRVDAIPLTGNGAVHGAFLPADGEVFPSPWSAVWTNDGRAVVSLYEANTVALVDPCHDLLVATADPPSAVTYDPAIHLQKPVDVDGNGTEESEVTTMAPRHPQALAVAGSTVIAAYTNILAYSFTAADPPVLTPGVLASWRIEGDALVDPRTTILPCDNPQGITAEDSGDAVWVSCSGAIGTNAEGLQEARTDGALLRVLVDGLALDKTIDVARFVPGSPVLVGDRIVAGSLLRPDLLSVSASGEGTPILSAVPGGEDNDAIFEIAHIDGALLVPLFTRDTVLVLDDTTLKRHPSFPEGFAVGPGGDAFRGPLAIDARHVEGSDIDALVLLAISSEVVPLVVSPGLAP